MVITNCLWIGKRLSTMERLALTSHLKVGHECHLWTYGDVENVPNGVIVEDGNNILPASEIFVYKTPEGRGSVSAFSNLFRYKLIYERGGWWCDADVVCLKPFEFEQDHVVASEIPYAEKHWEQPTTCVFKCPPGSDLMRYCLEISLLKDRDLLEWGEIGPMLMLEACLMLNVDNEPYESFCPVPWFDAHKLVSQASDVTSCYGVHLWNEMWRSHSIDKDGEFPDHCLYEELKRYVFQEPDGNSTPR